MLLSNQIHDQVELTFFAIIRHSIERNNVTDAHPQKFHAGPNLYVSARTIACKPETAPSRCICFGTDQATVVCLIFFIVVASLAQLCIVMSSTEQAPQPAQELGGSQDSQDKESGSTVASGTPRRRSQRSVKKVPWALWFHLAVVAFAA
jgi:hypothetical protein